MSKQKIILTDNLYSIKPYSDYNKTGYMSKWEDKPEMFDSIFKKNNMEIILPFNDKKDVRKGPTKASKSCFFDLEGLLNQTHEINSDFTFNQNEDSNTFFNFAIKADHINEPSKNNCVFTLNGAFSNITLSCNAYKKYIFNFNNKNFRDLIDNNFNVYDKTTEEIYIKNPCKYVNIESLQCKNLKKLDIENCKKVSFACHNFNCGKIKEINFKNVEEVSLSFSDYFFSELDVKNFHLYDKKTIKSRINSMFETASLRINKHCILSFPEDCWITSNNLLPQNDSFERFPHHKWKIKDILPNSNSVNGQIKIDPFSLICAMHKKKTLVTKQWLDDVENALKLAVQTPELAKQEKEKKHG